MENSKKVWKPWHEIVKLKEDVRNDSLTLADFAADLHDVVMQDGKRPIYEDPEKFFALTYPTLALRDIACDVIHRLAAKNTKAIRLLDLTYGGGKTHTLITLRHLVSDPESLPNNLHAIEQFKASIQIPIPKSCVATLCFDKLDFEKGMKVRGVNGETRWLKKPWSVLAFQIAGEDGLRLIHAEGENEERDTPPAEPILVELLSKPQEKGNSTLLLIDEVLMYASNKLVTAEDGKNQLINFFQYLCQAVVKVDNCAMVASLLASDPEKDDEFGRSIYNQISQIFGRQKDEGVQPVGKGDVAEVLRRRFFDPTSIGNKEEFRANVAHAVSNIAKLHPDTHKKRSQVEAQFLESFPFHPELTEIFYTRWTQLVKFQRTRGILRAFALALRDAEKWDKSPIIGPNVFLPEPNQEKLSESARELASTASREHTEGASSEWGPILEGELSKARIIQSEQNVFEHREIEQFVFSVFLNSQPISQKAHTPDLISLIGPTGPDHIELEKALHRWTELSWFLDESEFDDTSSTIESYASLPKSWRLGNKPNLKQMHDHACKNRVPNDSIETMLKSQLEQNAYLKNGVKASGVKFHMLPDNPKDVADDGEFHFVLLGPNAASDTKNISSLAKRFIIETTGQDRPRTNKNAIIVVTPSLDGLDSVRAKIREYLGWEEVRSQLKDQVVDEARDERVSKKIKQTQKIISDAICQAWTMVVTVNEKSDIHTFKVSIGDSSLFSVVKSDKRSRILETAFRAEAMLPGGPYDLWLENEDFRLVKDLTSAFTTSPNLPKMLHNREIYETIKSGINSGMFVAKLNRPDNSIKTWWYCEIEDSVLRDIALELYLPDKIELSELDFNTLTYGKLPNLWNSESILVSDVVKYFADGRIVDEQKGDYTEKFRIPKCSKENVENAVIKSVEQGVLRIVDGTVSFQNESIPDGLISDSSKLLEPLEQIEPTNIQPKKLKGAWKDEQTNAFVLSNELAKSLGYPIPWSVLSKTIENAINSRWLEYAPTSEKLPSDFQKSKDLILMLPNNDSSVIDSASEKKTEDHPIFAELETNELQDLVEKLPQILETTGGLQLKFHLGVSIDNPSGDDIAEIVNSLNRLFCQINKDLKI